MSSLVLLVDDDPVVNFLHQRMMTRYCTPAQIKIFVDGKQALDFLMAEHQNYDSILVLLDINMPEMNGWEFLDIVSQSDMREKLVVFMLSSSVAEEDVRKSERYDLVEGYLIKPLSQEKCNWLKSRNTMRKFFESESSNG